MCWIWYLYDMSIMIQAFIEVLSFLGNYLKKGLIFCWYFMDISSWKFFCNEFSISSIYFWRTILLSLSYKGWSNAPGFCHGKTRSLFCILCIKYPLLCLNHTSSTLSKLEDNALSMILVGLAVAQVLLLSFVIPGSQVRQETIGK